MAPSSISGQKPQENNCTENKSLQFVKTPSLALPCFDRSLRRLALHCNSFDQIPTHPTSQPKCRNYLHKLGKAADQSTTLEPRTYAFDSRNRIHFPSFSHDMSPIEFSFSPFSKTGEKKLEKKQKDKTHRPQESPSL